MDNANLRIVEENGGYFLLLNGGKVSGPRDILVKVLRGLLSNKRTGETRQIGDLINEYLHIWQDKKTTDGDDSEDEPKGPRTNRLKH